MGFSDNGGVQHSGGGIQGIDGGVDTELGQGSGQDSCGIQMGESGSGGGIGKIIGRDVDGLDRGNGTLLGGGNSFLEGTQIGSEGGLVTDGRGDTTQKGRHFGAGLGESEDVVDEEQDVLSFLISEVLSEGKSGQTDSSSGTGGLVHLSVDEGALGVASWDNDLRFDHFVVEIVSFSGSFTDTGKDGVTTVVLGDVVDEFLDQDSFTDTGTSEETDFTTSGVRGQQVDDLNTSDQDFSSRTLFIEGGGFSVDGVELLASNGASFVNRLTNDIDNSSEGLGSDGHHDWVAGVLDVLSSDETVSGVQGNSSDSGITEMLSNFEDESVLGSLDFKGIKNRRKAVFELDIDDGTDDLGDFADFIAG